MIKIIITLLLVCLFFFSGQLIQAVKKLLALFVSNILKLLAFFGIKINRREKKVQVSQQFKETYKDIKIVKLSKKNLKQVSSIDWLNLSIFIITGILIICNLGIVSGNAISNWMYTWLKNIKIIKSAVDMNTLYTATLFSALSFSASRILVRWKDTKQQRLERKQQKLKEKALELMDSKELLDNIKKKDEQKYKELK